MAKYDGLKRHLDSQRATGSLAVELTFAEMDRLVDGLPASARTNRTWWANSSHTQAKAWRQAGWHVGAIEMVAQRVRFDPGEVGGSYTQRGFAADATRKGKVQRDALPPLDEHVDARLHFEWLDGGSVVLENEERLVFPRLSNDPGIYRLSLLARSDEERTRIYIGETDSLPRRMRSYARPGPTQHTSTRVNAVVLDHLREGGVVRIAVAIRVTISDADGERALDLHKKSCRLAAENLALALAHQAATHDIENLQ